MSQHLDHHSPLFRYAGRLAALALAGALLGTGAAAAPSALTWGIVETAGRGCVGEVSLQFQAAGALGGHPPQPLCGSTAVRMYPEPLPAGLLTVSLKNQRGEPRRYQIPLDTVFRRENVRMEQSVLELVYGQDSVELWVRPLDAAGGGAPDGRFASDAAVERKRIFFGGMELDAAPPRPGISRSR
ncbi:hypothetical protein [Ramlibacter sp.]|uniref:hypothetical protein n=1 Tax=Ramlibacter sp. TaxID=1917967 RepID=UPI002BC56DD9|nr:hypothetical protein [Ramlibacter sp.]HWI83320.1 hypothetical protein [Ramlibacter sp.]